MFRLSFRTRASAAAKTASLWERLGGEAVVKPMVSAIYDRHASDPLSADYFGPNKFDNCGDADVVKNHVFTFFSSGIGGPHEYKGRSMVEAHKKMHIDETAFHAVAYHVMEQMEKFKAGGKAERDEVLGILHSLKPDVQSNGVAKADPVEGATLWERLGGEAVVKPMVSAIYDRHASDPLSADYFGPNKFDNCGDADVVKNHVFTFFSSGIGGPHEYKGRSMVEAHKKMHIDETAFHAVAYHVMEQMEKFKAGGKAERDEVLGILHSLKADVQSGSATE